MVSRLSATTSSFLLALFLLLPTVLGAQPPDPGDACRVGEAVILATNSARLATDVTIHSGDVVVNDFGNGATLGNGFELYIDRKTSIAGSLKADRIKIFSQASVAGNVFYNQINNAGSIGGGLFSPLLVPVFDPLPTFTPVSPPRGPISNLTVGTGQTLTLAAGDYGNVIVHGSGTILFTGGIYNFESVDLVEDAGKLRFLAPAEVRINGRLRTRKLAFIGPAAGSGLSASAVVFYIAGINGLDGGLGSTPEAARIGTDSTVSANFYVPNGTLRLELRTVASGAFLARDVQVDSRAQVSLASAFANRPPTVVPQEVLTHGASSLVITLTGADPEGQSLAFSTVGGPTVGTLSAITPIVPDPIADPNNPGTFIQPPITQATVTYSPNHPAADAPDSFTFRVTDGCGKTGMAVIEINPLDPSPPPPSPTAVDALDLLTETVTDTAVTIPLAAGAPNGDILAFSIESLPGHGSLRDGGTAVESVPFALSGSTVTYTPDSGFLGSDAFTFRAIGTPSGTSDAATVTVGVSERPELATDAELETPLNQPIQVTLQGNPGGTGSSGSPATTPALNLSLIHI